MLSICVFALMKVMLSVRKTSKALRRLRLGILRECISSKVLKILEIIMLMPSVHIVFRICFCFY